MKIDQIAFYAHNEEQALEIKKTLGLAQADWVQDKVVGTAKIRSGNLWFSDESTARLQFNYDYGIELEILTFIHGSNWHACAEGSVHSSREPFMSHIGVHLEDDEDFPQLNIPLVQRMETVSHTNPYINGLGRTYIYEIYDARPIMGCYLKYIKRVHNKKDAGGSVTIASVTQPPPERPKTAADILEEAAETYAERHKVYGDNYKLVGKVMEGLFPDGLEIKTAHDWDRLHIFLLMVVKQTRYIQNWHAGGHQDSVRDNTVYSAMLEEIDLGGRQ